MARRLLKYPICADICKITFSVKKIQPFSSLLTLLILSQLRPGSFLRLAASESDDLRLQHQSEYFNSLLDETRLVCFLVGVFGLIYTIFNLGFLSSQISNPFFLNLTILLGLVGFVNFMLYPNVLKYCLVNGIRNQGLLRSMNGFMTGFSAALLVLLFSFPITGLGLSLILIPAPIIYGYYSRKYIDQTYRGEGVRFSVLAIFNQDLKRIAWFSFTLIFITLVLAFVGIFMGII